MKENPEWVPLSERDLESFNETIDTELDALETQREADLDLMKRGLGILLNASYYILDLQKRGLLPPDMAVFAEVEEDVTFKKGSKNEIFFHPHLIPYSLVQHIRLELDNTGHNAEAEEIYKQVSNFHRPDGTNPPL